MLVVNHVAKYDSIKILDRILNLHIIENRNTDFDRITSRR